MTNTVTLSHPASVTAGSDQPPTRDGVSASVASLKATEAISFYGLPASCVLALYAALPTLGARLAIARVCQLTGLDHGALVITPAMRKQAIDRGLIASRRGGGGYFVTKAGIRLMPKITEAVGASFAHVPALAPE